MIDARYHEHGRLGQQAEHPQVHAIGWRAVYGVAPLPDLIDAQGSVQSQCMADRALLAIGRHDEHLAQRLERLRQRAEPLRVNPVVIRHENHGCHRSPRHRPQKKSRSENLLAGFR